MQPGDLLVCVFIDEFGVGDTFEKWPLHVTLVPWFRLDAGPRHFTQKLTETLAPLRPFTDTAGERRIFSKRDANILDKHAWQALHDAVLACVYNHGEPAARQFRFVAEAYQPHVTVQGGAEVHHGDTIDAEAVYIVEQHGDYKQVTAKITL